MKDAADLLYLLASFSMRTQFIAKAVKYGKAGHELFPDDTRLRDIYAYALLHNGDLETCSGVLDAGETTRNQGYVKTRLAIVSDKPKATQQQEIRGYLNDFG